MSNIYKTESIFKNRDILFEAVKQESISLKKDLLTGNKTLKVFSRISIDKKDISATVMDFLSNIQTMNCFRIRMILNI